MKKIKISANIVLDIIKGIMSEKEFNYIIEDKTAPSEWQGKTVQQALNVEYYTYKHRPMDTELLIRELLRNSQDVNSLMSLNRSFCIMSLDSTERVYSKDNDVVTVSASLEYWIQTEKVKLLEDLLEDISIATNGIRIPVQIGSEARKTIVLLSSLNSTAIQEITEFGEMSVCDLQVDMIFSPEVTSRSDYTVEFLFEAKWCKVPFTGLSVSNSMTQKSVPYANQVSYVGNINLSKVRSMVMTFDGYQNSFINYLTKQSLSSDYEEEMEAVDNNERLIMRITRNEMPFTYECVIKDHLITVQEDTGNEIHSLTLTARGMKDGIA